MTNTTRHTMNVLRYLAQERAHATGMPVIVDAADGGPSLGTDAITALKQRLGTAQADAAEDRAALTATTKQLDAARAVASELSTTATDLYVELMRARTQVQRLETERDTYRDGFAAMSEALRIAAQQIADIHEQCATAEQMAAHWQQEAERLERELTDATISSMRK